MLRILEELSSGAAFLLFFLLATNPRGVNRSANRWLSVFCFCLFVMTLDDLFINEQIYQRYPHFIGMEDVAAFLAAPAFFLAVDYFVSPHKTWQRRDYLHFSLIFLEITLSLPFLLSTAGVKWYHEQHPEAASSLSKTLSAFLVTAFFIQIFAYWIWSFLKLNKHIRQIGEISSREEQVNLRWLRHFLIIFLCMLTVWFADGLLELPWLEYPAYFIYFAGILMLAFYAILQEEIYPFQPEERVAIQHLLQEKEAPGERKRLMTAEEVEQLKKVLDAHMLAAKPFLDNDLGLPKLAKQVQCSTHQLSYLLNEGYGESFYQFINRYRVAAAQELLSDPSKHHLTLLAIAYEAGFNSKTVFNTAFKNSTGLSPSDFRKQHLS